MEIRGDRSLFERASKRLRNLAPFLRQVGHYAVGRAQYRLTQVLRQDDEAIRTGRLESSLQVFRVTGDQLVCGSNVPYAAQVHFGGIIEPKNAKALAIPLTPALRRSRLWPRDLDPAREKLRFQPYTGGKPNVFGLLIDEGEEPTGRKRKRRGHTPYGPGALFALAYWVSQPARPYLCWDDEDRRAIRDDLWPRWLGG
jgi:phage gpG-like protein